MKQYLIVNTGSVSAKYSIYSENSELFFAHFEMLDNKCIVTFYDLGRVGKKRTEEISKDVFDNSLNHFLSEAIIKDIIKDKDDIVSIALRVVSPGIYFQSDRLVDDLFIKNIKEKEKEAPLHVTVTIKEITELKKVFPKTPIMGISDSAFHKDVPYFVKYYGIPKTVSDDLEIYHYGYHGISIGSIVSRVGTLEKPYQNVIICHLGGGSSVVAVKDGKSFNTSMGYSPLEGVVMSTRAGDLDPVVAFQLCDKLNMNPLELEKYLNNQSGLLGISGKSGDIRDLLISELNGDLDAKLALHKFVMSIKKYIGAFGAQMGGIDELIFSGTIGERSPVIRERICEELGFLGIKLNKDINKETIGASADISADNDHVKVRVVLTDEMADMAERLINFKS